MKPERAAAASSNLNDTRLDAFDEVRERRLALVGEVGSPDELDIERGPVGRRAGVFVDRGRNGVLLAGRLMVIRWWQVE